MTILAIIILLIVTAIVIAAITYAYRIREKSIKEFKRRYASRYVIKHLTQQNFTKAVNIVTDLVTTDGADIEVTYKDQVVFNGYIDIDPETGKDTPHFWYNKVILDKYGIDY